MFLLLPFDNLVVIVLLMITFGNRSTISANKYPKLKYILEIQNNITHCCEIEKFQIYVVLRNHYFNP